MVSTFICGENSNSLGIYATVTRYPVVHCASWPSYFGPDVDLHRVSRMTTVSKAYTLKSFLVKSASRISEEYLEAMSANVGSREFMTKEREECMGGHSHHPLGTIIVRGDGDSAELLACELDLHKTIIPHVYQDYADTTSAQSCLSHCSRSISCNLFCLWPWKIAQEACGNLAIMEVQKFFDKVVRTWYFISTNNLLKKKEAVNASVFSMTGNNSIWGDAVVLNVFSNPFIMGAW